MGGHRLGEPPRPLPTGGRIIEWDSGDEAWWRVYHRDYRSPDPLHRRTFGPVSRFDHHQAPPGAPAEDPDGRSALYLGREPAVAAAEVFWDQEDDEYNLGADPLVARVCVRHHVAQVRPRREAARLLSIVGADVDLIGALPELSTGSADQHPIAQAWARAVYEDYTDAGVCGIMYQGAHQFGICVVLWDRAPTLDVIQDAKGDRDWQVHQPGAWERVLAAYSASGRRHMTKVTSDRCPRCRELGLR